MAKRATTPRRALRIGLLVAVVAPFATQSTATAQSSEQVAVSVETVALAADTPAKIELTNTSSETLTLVLSAWAGDPPARLDVVPAGPVIVESGSAVDVTISAPSFLSSDATLDGKFVVGTGGNTVAVFDLTVGAREAPAATVKSHTVVFYSVLPGVRTPRSEFIPASTENCIDTDADEWARTLTATSGRHQMELTATCAAEGIRLTSGDFTFDQHAVFTATLKGAGEDVQVSVIWTTIILWPILVMLAGFGAGLWVHRWTKGGRDLRLTRVRLGNLRFAAADADAVFRGQAAGSAWAGLAIADSVASDVDALIAQLAEVDQQRGPIGFVTERQADALKALRDAAAPIEASIHQWRTEAAEDLVALATARMENPELWALMPSAVAPIDEWLNGRWPGSSADVATLVSEANHLAGALRVIAAYADGVSDLADLEEAVDDATGDTFVDADSKRRILEKRLNDDDRPDAATSLADVDGLAEAVIEFLDAVETVAADVGAPGLEGLTRKAYDGAPLSVPGPSPLARIAAARARASVVTRDNMAFALIGFVAIWSGLEALYFGKPWGNVVDVVGAFGWAFTATAGLSLALTLLTQPNAQAFTLSTDD